MIISFVIVLIVSILIIIYLPKYQINQLESTNGLEIKNIENELRKTIIQLMGGIFLIIGILFSWITYTQTKERDFSEQINKIISLMGNDKDYIKIGAIYSLEQIINNDSNNSIILDILTSYIRDNAKLENKIHLSNNNELRQAVVKVISKIRKYNSDMQIDLSSIDLSNLFLQSINLKNIKFIDSSFHSSDLKNTNFDNGILSGSSFDNANLENTSFKNTDLRYASFRKANIRNVNFSGADLSGITGYDKKQILQQSITDNKTIFP